VSGILARLPLALAAASLLGESVAVEQAPPDSAPPLVGHGDKGFEFRTRDGNYLLQIQARVQIRYAYPWDADPVTFDFTDVDQHIFKVNRARLKVGGHGFRPWLKYYFEYELAAGNLLDFRVWLELWTGLRLKAGQWKAHYSRERVISSGQQQLSDRSLINRPFTVDRQQGLSLYGRLEGGGAADLSYWASVFTGTGRGARENDDEHLMWMGRVQWNPFGRVVPFSGSDLERRPKPAASIALAAVTNRSPYTRFSQDGGGQLEGFGDGVAGQYRVNQWMGETAFMLRGFSWQQEFHWKRIIDHVNGTETTLLGNYAQLGYFLHEAIRAIPPPLELALRFDVYDPDSEQPDDLQRDIALAANWFFNGHLNKLTAEVSHFTFQENATVDHEGWRVRLQWDVSF
jgi:phosphate-selective porin